MARDTQRMKLYRAEQAAERRLLREEIASDGAIPPRNPRLTRDEVWDLVKRVTDNKVMLTLVDDRPKAKFDRDRLELTLPPWARCPLVILHQLAHMFIHPNFPEHGAEFIAEQLRLYGEFIAPDVADYFRTAYELEGVQVAPSPKQARRFLPYCKKVVSREGVTRLIHVITRDAEVIVDTFIDFDNVTNTLCIGDRQLPVRELRYASWATAAA